MPYFIPKDEKKRSGCPDADVGPLLFFCAKPALYPHFIHNVFTISVDMFGEGRDPATSFTPRPLSSMAGLIGRRS